MERNAPTRTEGEPNAARVVVVIEGGCRTLEAACEAVEANIPVLVFGGSGKAADFIAAAYDRRDKPLVLHALHIIYVLSCLTSSVG